MKPSKHPSLFNPIRGKLPYCYNSRTKTLSRTMCIFDDKAFIYGSFDHMRRLFLFEFDELKKRKRLQLLRELEEFHMVDGE